MPRKAVTMPANVSPSPYYSPAVRAGDFIFISGQGPRDPETGQFAGENIEQQTELTLNSVRAVLRAAGADLDDVVKVHVHLRHIDDFDRFNAVYTRFFGNPKPARTTVGSHVGDILIEIDAVAYTGST